MATPCQQFYTNPRVNPRTGEQFYQLVKFIIIWLENVDFLMHLFK